ncbi:uncharacterized protein LOC126887220 isoform X2 [Diabrotica virgifera virgifera]|uniref:ZP domain-containing protein n=1 Tax=Diabrotica virgifera virgifera TaxID=50390 RepID=A0ABM5KK46_DIAVI|nr:uncharacterized protein LOC126887220 isoform X2 [Diabrotica virgifera virgifera]
MKLSYTLVAILATCLIVVDTNGEQKAKTKREKKTNNVRTSRQLNNSKSNNADQMVQNILRWLQDVYGQQSRTSRSYYTGQQFSPYGFTSANNFGQRAFRQGSLREYLPPTNSQKPRPFEPRPGQGSGIDDEGNFIDRGYPPAGSITPQPPFNIYTNPATGGITGISSPGISGGDYSTGPGSTGYPTQTPTRPPYQPQNTYVPPSTYYTNGARGYTDSTGVTQRPGYTSETGRPPYTSDTQTPGQTSPGYTGYPTSSPSGFTGYPTGTSQGSTRYPTGQTGYPTFPTSSPSGFTGYPSGAPTGPSFPTYRPGETVGPGDFRTPSNEFTGYPTSRPTEPSGFTGYPSGAPTGPSFPTYRPGETVGPGDFRTPSNEFTGYPTSRPTEPTGYPTGRPTDTSGYTTGRPTDTSGYPTGRPTDTSGFPTVKPTESPGYTTSRPTETSEYPTGPQIEYTSGRPTVSTELPTGPPSELPTSSSTGVPSYVRTTEPPTESSSAGVPAPTSPGVSPPAPVEEETETTTQPIIELTTSESSAEQTTASTALPTAAPTSEVPEQTASPNGESGIIEIPSDEDEKHPPHIHALDVECAKDMMTINIEFNREFNGVIYSKGYYNMPECRYVNENSGKTKYSFTVNLNMCGTEFINAFDTEGQSYLQNVLVLQNELGIQEVWDTVRSVRCLWEGNLKEQLSVTLMVGMLSQEIVTFSGDTAMAKLDVLLGRGPFGQPVNGLVKIGEQMTLVVSVSGDPGFDVQVKDCRATDSAGSSSVALTDDNGCILKPKLFGSFQKTRNTGDSGASIIAYAYFNAFKFPDIMDIMIECNIELCKTDCEMCPDPNPQLEPAKRRKRDVSLGNETLHDSVLMAKHLRIVLPEDLAAAVDIAQHDGVCMSTQSFVYGSSILISLLTASSLLSAYLWFTSQKLRMLKN